MSKRSQDPRYVEGWCRKCGNRRAPTKGAYLLPMHCPDHPGEVFWVYKRRPRPLPRPENSPQGEGGDESR